MSIQYGGDKITFADGSTVASGFTGFKNRIINGAMMIDQRNAGASFTPTGGQFATDRFRFGLAQASKITAQQSTTAPTGFINSLLVTSSSSYSVLAGDFFNITHPIEGLNVADLAWGTANASTVTISFWVRSSLTGLFGGTVQNSAGNRSYPFSYTISAANTWEQKTITIAGDTTGTWLTTNGSGIILRFALGYGSTYGSGTAGAWVGSDVQSVTGATSVVGTSGATFYITGVQLEKGSTATSFDYRPYGTELALCQRYYEKSFPIGTAPASNAGVNGSCIQAGSDDGSSLVGNAFYKVTKRATATVTTYNPSGAGSTFANGGTPLSYANDDGGTSFYTTTRTGARTFVNWVASAEL